MNIFFDLLGCLYKRYFLIMDCAIHEISHILCKSTTEHTEVGNKLSENNLFLYVNPERNTRTTYGSSGI